MILGAAWWKGRVDSWRLSSDLPMDIMVHPPTHTIINLIEYLDIKQDLAVDVTTTVTLK